MGFESRNVSKIIIEGENSSAINAIKGTLKEFESAQSKFQGLSGGMSGAFESLTSKLNPIMLLGGGAIALAGGLAAVTRHSIQMADEIYKASQKVGMTTESLSTLKFAASLADVQFDQLTTGLERFSKNVYNMQDSTGKLARDSFAALGISVKDSNGNLKDSQQLLYNVADKFNLLKDGVAKTALAMNLFGRAGANMIPLLNEGSASIKEMQQEAKDLGLEISEDAGKKAQDFQDNIKILEQSFVGIGNTAMTDFLPALLQISESFIEFMKNINTGKPLIDGIAVAFKVIASAAYGAVGVINIMGTSLGTLAASTIAFATGDFKGAINIWESGAARVTGIINGTASSISKLWESGDKYSTMMENFKKSLELHNQNNAVAKFNTEWEKVKKTMDDKVMVLGMTAIQKAQYDLIKQTDEWKNKFKKIPGSLKTIFDYYHKIEGYQALVSMQTFNPTLQMQPTMPMKTDPYTMQKKSLDDYEKYHKQALDNIKLYSDQDYQAMAQGVSGTFGSMASAAKSFYDLSGQKSQEAFAMYKAFAIGQAMIATYESAVKAYDSMVGIPLVGPALAVAAAAAAVTFGLSNVARIASSSPGNSSGGSVSSASVSSQIPQAPQVNPVNANMTTSNTGITPPQITLNVYGSVVSYDQFARELIPALNKAVNDGLALGATR